MTQEGRLPDDAELVRMAQGGSDAAFEALYDRHAGGVARALASFAGPDRDTLDDLAQEVFLRVVKGLPSYRPSHPFAHWLYTIALNVGRNHARRRAVVVPVNPAALDAVAGASGPADDEAAALMRRVERLPEPMRDVVSLRVGSDLSYGEIAELLGIPEGTARSRMHAAVRALRGRVGVDESRRSNEHE